MKIPPNLTESEVIAAVNRAIDALAKNYVFGIYDEDDIRQQGWIFALEILERERYDEKRPLVNFIYTHIKNRYLNLIRDKNRRNDPPCSRCHAKDYCTEDGIAPCKKYDEWLKRNNAKANLQRPKTLDHISTEDRERHDRSNSHIPEDAALNEILAKIDEHLPMGLRPIYLQMRAGVPVAKSKRLQVETAIKEIVQWPSNSES